MAILKSGRISAIDTPAGLKSRASRELGTKATLDQAFIHFNR
jgi:hypothetical protein